MKGQDWTIRENGKLTISGGTIFNDATISVCDETSQVNISDGGALKLVNSQMTIDNGSKINITSDESTLHISSDSVIFGRGKTLSDILNMTEIGKISNEGAIVLLEKKAQSKYPLHSSEGITVYSNTVEATWEIENNETGIKLSSGTFIPFDTVLLKKPTFTSQPSSASYLQNEDVTTLFASVEDVEGVLSYQWYKSNINDPNAGEPIDDETNLTFKPSSATVGTSYYYVEATNTFRGESLTTTSDLIKVEVKSPVNIKNEPTLDGNDDAKLDQDKSKDITKMHQQNTSEVTVVSNQQKSPMTGDNTKETMYLLLVLCSGFMVVNNLLKKFKRNN